jgi:FkbM family methyltransferase
MPSALGLIRRTCNGLAKRLARLLLLHLVQFRRGNLQLQGLGEGEGTWTVPVNLIQPGWICYCVGVGLDATFDSALAMRGARVFTFDPTPRSIEFMKTLDYDHKRISFYPIGIWNEHKQLKFYAPMNRRSANYSVRDIHGTSEYFVADCRRLINVMTELGHSRIDLLKLDIEGAWYEVLQDIIKEDIQISVLCVEFDSPTSYFKARRMIRELRAIGLEVVHQQRDNFLFVQRRLL